MKQNSKQHHNRGDIFKRWVFEVFRARFTSTLDRIFFFYVISIVNHSAFRFALRSQGWHLVQSNQVSDSILSNFKTASSFTICGNPKSMYIYLHIISSAKPRHTYTIYRHLPFCILHNVLILFRFRIQISNNSISVLHLFIFRMNISERILSKRSIFWFGLSSQLPILNILNQYLFFIFSIYVHIFTGKDLNYVFRFLPP